MTIDEFLDMWGPDRLLPRPCPMRETMARHLEQIIAEECQRAIEQDREDRRP